MKMQTVRLAVAAALAALWLWVPSAQQNGGEPLYFPARDAWERRAPAAVGMNADRLAAAVAWAETHDSGFDFARFAQTDGLIGPLPASRARTNGLVLRHGYIVAEFGDVSSPDPSFSVAKSYLAAIFGLAIDRGLVRDVNDRVADHVNDGGSDGPHNSRITWEQHLRQTSEWDGELFGKRSALA